MPTVRRKTLRGLRNGRRLDRTTGAPLTLSFEEAARHLGWSKRTLIGHLRRTDAHCLVRVGKRYRLDRKGFFRWCRQLGFESAGPAYL